MKPLLLSLLLLRPIPAAAAPVVWTVTGTVTETSDTPLATLLPVDQPFTVTLVADPAAPDGCDTPLSGFYETAGATVTIGRQTWTAAATFWEVNNQAGSCAVASPGVVTRSLFDNAPFSMLTLGWGVTEAETFPAAAEDGFAWFAEHGMAPTVYAVTDVGVPSEVPEPSPLLLVATGLALSRRTRRSR